jgi:hypothetical protein
MKINLVQSFINAFSFRKWNRIAKQHDLVLTQRPNGKFRCTDLNNEAVLSCSETAQEAVIDAIHFETRSRMSHGV